MSRRTMSVACCPARRTVVRACAAFSAVALAMVLAMPLPALAEESIITPRIPIAENLLTSGELVERADMFDGSVVVFRGEAIGEAMVRGNWAWLHVNDDSYMERNVEEGQPLGGLNSGMPIWVPAAEAAEVMVFGDYRHEGDIIEVRGVFNAACPEHGGDMDIHAVYVDVIRSGREVQDPVSGSKIVWAVLAALGGGGAYLLDRNMDRYREWRRGLRVQ